MSAVLLLPPDFLFAGGLGLPIEVAGEAARLEGEAALLFLPSDAVAVVAGATGGK